MRQFFFIILIGGATLSLQAQVLSAPDLNCVTTAVNGDVTLEWNLPSNGCGPFVSYQIYASDVSASGPFILLQTIGLQGQKSYTHVNADGNNKTWWYYMKSNYNCPGYTAASSDTIDNLDPLPPAIQYITVKNGNVEIHWENYISPETFSYVIYLFNGGFNPIDTVYGRGVTQYTDNTAGDPNNKPEQYTIAAMDSCNNVGPLYDKAHRSIYLRAAFPNCQSFIDLNWNKYENWPAGVSGYEVYTAKNGAPFTLASTRPADSLHYHLTGFSAGDQICAYVEAVEGSGKYRSRSNEWCATASTQLPASYAYFTNLTVNPDNTVDVEFIPDQEASIDSIVLKRSDNDVAYKEALTLVRPYPTPPSVMLTDTDADPGQGAVYYQVTIEDSCDLTYISEPARTIFLEGRSRPNFTNNLEWEPLILPFATVNEYTLYRDDNGLMVPVTTLPGSATGFDDDISILFETGGNFCYVLEADVTLNLPNRSPVDIVSRSNVACVKQYSIIYAPTAIVLSGQNNFFKPVISFAQEGTYTLRIFNRWGQLLFETHDPDAAWYGSYQGRDVPQGVYTYAIEVTGANNNVVNRNGTFLVIP